MSCGRFGVPSFDAARIQRSALPSVGADERSGEPWRLASLADTVLRFARGATRALGRTNIIAKDARVVPGLLRFTGAVDRAPAIDAWLDGQPSELGSIARTWFALMRRCGAGVRELMHDGFATACVEDAPFAYVGVFRDHVNVGFFHGAVLPDPAGLLQGTGRYMRHVKVKPGSTVDESSLEALIASAYRDIVARLEAAK